MVGNSSNSSPRDNSDGPSMSTGKGATSTLGISARLRSRVVKKPSASKTEVKGRSIVARKSARLSKKTFATVSSLDDKTVVNFVDGRPATAVGKQVDHASAYALFKQIVVSAVIDKPLDEGMKAMLGIIDRYAPNEIVQTIAEKIKDDLQYVSGEHDKKVFEEIKKKKVSKAIVGLIEKRFADHKCLFLSNALSDIISKHLELRNKLEKTTFPPDGLSISPPQDEATRVKSALSYLRNLTKDVAQHKSKIADKILDLIWYPKIPAADLHMLSDKTYWSAVIK